MNNTLLHLVPLFAVMRPEGLFFLRIVGVIGLLIVLPLGVLLFRKQDEWFGRYTDNPNETSGSLGYGRAQCWLAYLGILHLMLYLAIGL